MNVGGALIPVTLSLYLLVKNRLFQRAILAVAVVALVDHLLAVPVRGVGITVPVFVPPISAALAAMVLGWRQAPTPGVHCGKLGDTDRRRSFEPR